MKQKEEYSKLKEKSTRIYDKFSAFEKMIKDLQFQEKIQNGKIIA